MKSKLLVKSFGIRGADGNDLRISETVEGDQAVISIQQNDENGRTATVRLDKKQFDAFFDIKYSITVIEPEEEEKEKTDGTL